MESLLGIGTGAAGAVIVAMFIVRHAVATAVELAGKKKIEKLKDTLAKELEQSRIL